MNTLWDAEPYRYQPLVDRWGSTTRTSHPPCQFRMSEVKHEELTDQAPPLKSHQWPWRGFAFASDLGSVGYLVKCPQLGFLGWILALPYYAYAIFSQPKGQKRNEEIVYQSTANGLIPLAEAKLGTVAGHHFTSWLSKRHPGSVLTRLPASFHKITGGVLALAILTPTLGDPASQFIVSRYQQGTEGKH